MLTVIARPDARDWYAAPALGIDYRDGLDARRQRACASPTAARWATQKWIRKLRNWWRKRCKVRGARRATSKRSILELEDPIAIMQPLWSVALALAVAPMTPQQRALVDPPLLELAEPGLRLSALEYRQLEARARGVRPPHECGCTRNTICWSRRSLPITAFAVGARSAARERRCKRWWQWSPFTYPFNLTQQPAATRAVRICSRMGLPVAMQLVGAKFADAMVLRAARAYEKAHPFVTPKLGADGRALPRH